MVRQEEERLPKNDAIRVSLRINLVCTSGACSSRQKISQNNKSRLLFVLIGVCVCVHEKERKITSFGGGLRSFGSAESSAIQLRSQRIGSVRPYWLDFVQESLARESSERRLRIAPASRSHLHRLLERNGKLVAEFDPFLGSSTGNRMQLRRTATSAGSESK